MTITLRPYQSDLADSVRDAWSSGAQNVLMHLATGGGKTACLGSIVEGHEGASCVIAHRSELVSQVSQSLAQYGVMHDVICSTAVRRIIAAVHIQRFGKCFLRPGAMCRVASVDTLIRRSGLESWAATVSLWVVDECFPAGTLVDGRPIETLRPGDIVTAFNEETGGFEPRKVVRLFKNVAPDYMVSIDFGEHHVINCTAGHPFWTRRGWVAALDLQPTDEVLLHDDSMHELQNRNTFPEPIAIEPTPESREGILPTVLRVRSPREKPEASGRAFGNDDLLGLPNSVRGEGVENKPLRDNGATVLQQSVLGRIPAQDFLGNDGEDQSQVCVGADDNEQPGSSRGRERKDQRNAQRTRPQTENSGREREAVTGSRSALDSSILRPRLYGAMRGADKDAARERLPDELQTGLRERGVEAGPRGGRGFSYDGKPAGTGCEERQLSRWARVDRVTVFQRGNNERPGRHCDDGYVYNIEVEGLHTYIADGVVVHNCHHLVQNNKWHRAIEMFTHPQVRGLGPTATPVRADGKGLGRHADGVIDEMVAGPPPRWLIEEGWLSDYDVICPTSDLEMLTNVAASGDWSQKALKDAAKRSHIVGDVVGSYMQHARGRLGVTFATDVETATAMAGAYREAGVPSEVLTGETDDRLRASILQRFERREVLQLCVVDIVSEGFDLPSIEVLSMARPTQSLGLYSQQFGRGLRPVFAPGYDLSTRQGRIAAQEASSKGRRMLLIDHVGNFIRHQGGPDAPRVWSLDRREKRSSAPSDAQALRVCIECLKPFKRLLTACPHCGAEIPAPAGRNGPEQVDGDLALLSPEVLAALRAELPEDEARYRERLMASRLPEIPLRANMKRHGERLEALAELRAALAEWSGPLHASGLSDRELHKAIYLTWGCTALEMLAMSRADATAMTAKIKESMT